MFGDYCIMKNSSCEITMKCESMKGTVWKMSKEDFYGLKDHFEGVLKLLKREAEIFREHWYTQFISKI
jgi:hypothetical protein